MSHDRSSSPLSSVPDLPVLGLPIQDHHHIPPQPRKRSLQKPLNESGTQSKRPRRQSKTEMATNLKKSYEENPLFHRNPPLQPEPSSPAVQPSRQPPQIPSEPENPTQEKSLRNPSKIIRWKPQEQDKIQPAPNQFLPRLYIESQGSRSYPAHLRPYGPLWEPPAINYLVHRKPLRGWEVKSEPIEATPLLRNRMQAAEANLPYAPAMQLLSDLGWYKSKWNIEAHRENDRWGGWFDHIRLDYSIFSQSQLEDQQAEQYLPTGVQFPAAIQELSPPQKPTRIISNSLLNTWAADGHKGSLSLYAGPLTASQSSDGKEMVEQQKITFQRFASCRLSEAH